MPYASWRQQNCFDVFQRDFGSKAKVLGDARVWRAGSLGLAGELTRPRSEFSEAVPLRPEIDSLARWRVYQLWITYPSYEALRGETLYVGLRAAGMHDE